MVVLYVVVGEEFNIEQHLGDSRVIKYVGGLGVYLLIYDLLTGLPLLNGLVQGMIVKSIYLLRISSIELTIPSNARAIYFLGIALYLCISLIHILLACTILCIIRKIFRLVSSRLIQKIGKNIYEVFAILFMVTPLLSYIFSNNKDVGMYGVMTKLDYILPLWFIFLKCWGVVFLIYSYMVIRYMLRRKSSEQKMKEGELDKSLYDACLRHLTVWLVSVIIFCVPVVIRPKVFTASLSYNRIVSHLIIPLATFAAIYFNKILTNVYSRPTKESAEINRNIVEVIQARREIISKDICKGVKVALFILVLIVTPFTYQLLYNEIQSATSYTFEVMTQDEIYIAEWLNAHYEANRYLLVASSYTYRKATLTTLWKVLFLHRYEIEHYAEVGDLPFKWPPYCFLLAMVDDINLIAFTLSTLNVKYIWLDSPYYRFYQVLSSMLIPVIIRQNSLLYEVNFSANLIDVIPADVKYVLEIALSFHTGSIINYINYVLTVSRYTDGMLFFLDGIGLYADSMHIYLDKDICLNITGGLMLSIDHGNLEVSVNNRTICSNPSTVEIIAENVTLKGKTIPPSFIKDRAIIYELSYLDVHFERIHIKLSYYGGRLLVFNVAF